MEMPKIVLFINNMNSCVFLFSQFLIIFELVFHSKKFAYFFYLKYSFFFNSQNLLKFMVKFTESKEK